MSGWPGTMTCFRSRKATSTSRSSRLLKKPFHRRGSQARAPTPHVQSTVYDYRVARTLVCQGFFSSLLKARNQERKYAEIRFTCARDRINCPGADVRGRRHTVQEPGRKESHHGRCERLRGAGCG